MADAARDYLLLAAKDAAWDSVSGLAEATIAVIDVRHLQAKERTKHRARQNVKTVGEMLDRFVTFVTQIKPLSLEYSPTMSEADLRAWAERAAEALRS